MDPKKARGPQVDAQTYRRLFGGGGSSRGSSSPSQPTVKIDGTSVLINGVGYSVAPSLQAQFLASRGVSVSSSIQQQIQASIQLQEAQARATARVQAELQRQAQAEKQRILKEKVALIAKGARKEVRNSREIRTGDTLRITSWNKGGNTIRKVENLTQGLVTYSQFAPGRGGGSVGLRGRVNVGVQSQSDSKNIQSDLRKAGLTPIVNEDGQVIGFRSSDTQKTYSYNDAGIKSYEKDSKSGRAIILRASRENRESGMSTIPPMEKNKFKALSTRWINKIITLSDEIRESAKNKDISKLADLQRKKNKTAEEQREMARLKKIVFNNYKNSGKVIGLAFANSILSLGIGTVDLANAMIKDPIGTIKGLPRNLANAVVNDSKRFLKDPLEILIVTSEYVALGGAFKVVGAGSRATVRGISKISPSYVKDVGTGFVIRKAPAETFKVGTSKRFLKTRVLKPSIKRPFSSVANFLSGRKPGQFKRFTKDPGLILKKQTVSSGAKPLSAQARLAGKEVTAVNASANQITSWIRRKNIIRKPIPGEANFPSKIKNILKKFDSGTRLTTREFAEVNLWLQKNVAPNITLLERSLYLDPASGLRISRLGIQPQTSATLRDILRGNFRLFGVGQKPQVLIFENAKIAKFPKSLRNIERKLKSGKTLTVAETNKLIRWQVQTGSGKFKPIGSTIYQGGIELEVTLAPGEIIKRIKRVGFTYIDKKKVTFVTAEVFKPSKAILAQMKQAQLGKLSKGAVNKLNNFLSKKLGRKVRVETPDVARTFARKAGRMARRADQNIPVLRVRGSGIVVLRSGMRGLVARPSIRTPVRIGGRFTGRVVRGGRVVGRKATRPTGRPIRGGRVTRTPVKRTPGRRVVAKRITPVRPVRRVGRTGIAGRRSPPPKKPLVRIILPKDFQRRTLSKSQQTFYVVEKVRGKLKKLYPKPLTLKDARDYATYSIDNRLSKTAFFVPLGKAKNVVRPPKQIQDYYSKNSKKFRPYRIRFGKRKQMVNGFIEKRKYFQDTPGEKAQLRNLRRVSSVRRTQPKRKMSAERRRQLIAQLQRARAVRFGNRTPTRVTQRRTVTRRVQPKRTIKRKISPQQRRVLLKRLEMARRVRMRNLRR